jgi:hypothetical protein
VPSHRHLPSGDSCPGRTWGAPATSVCYGPAGRRPRSYVFALCAEGGPRWIRTTYLHYLRRALPQSASAGPAIDIGSVIDRDYLDESLAFVNSVDHPVGTASRTP